MTTKVAVVTGSNKGIGFAIVRGLCKQFQGDVYLTARDVGRGQKAVEDLKNEGLHAEFHQLDICDKTSIEKLKDFLNEKYGGLDVLVNNAGMAFKSADPTPFAEQAEVTMKTNFTALLSVCDTLFPILKPNARVVHLSSTVSTMFLGRCSDDIKKRIVATTSIEEVKGLMAEFVNACKDGTYKEKGWPEWGYGATKVGVTAITPIQQENIDKQYPGKNIIVNACCPGFVNTDMTGGKGHLSIDEGALTPIYLAFPTPDDENIRGKFLYQKKVYNWKAGEYPKFR